MLAVLGGLAEFERELIRARTVGRERGQRLYAKVPHGHWKTTTFVAALRHEGFIVLGHHLLGRLPGRLRLPHIMRKPNVSPARRGRA
jgi:hypothetical protein